MPWTKNEVEAFIKATRQIGPGNWADIKAETGNPRSSMQLKDKWRTLRLHSPSPPPRRRQHSPPSEDSEESGSVTDEEESDAVPPTPPPKKISNQCIL